MKPKYRLLSTPSKYGTHTIYQIQAIRDFGDVKSGNLGGWVESEQNLSHTGNCWVYPDGILLDQSRVWDNAKIISGVIQDDAVISAEAVIKDYSIIGGNAEIYGDVVVASPTPIKSIQESSEFMAVHQCQKKIDDGGERISYGEGKAIREPSTGKGRFDLVTPFGLSRLAKWYELGAAKYADRNWEKGIPFSRYLDSTMRHLNKFLMGMTDEDHLAAAAWNIFAIMHHQELGETDLDDLPHYADTVKRKPTLDKEKT